MGVGTRAAGQEGHEAPGLELTHLRQATLFTFQSKAKGPSPPGPREQQRASSVLKYIEPGLHIMR